MINKALEVIASRALTSRKFKQRNGEVVVLMYHGVVNSQPDIPDWCLLREEQFESQIKFLKDNFNVVSLSDAVEDLKNDTVNGPTAVITFDDGYQNNYEIAFPILKKYQVPATIYLTTKYIDSEETIWTGTLQDAFGKTTLNKMEWRGESLDLGSMESKRKSLATIKSMLKKEHLSVIEQSTSEIVDYLSGGEGFRIEPSSPYRMLSSDMIQNMAKSNLIEFGAHTHRHPILSGLSSQEQREEIERSVEIVSEITHARCRTFAYPNGGEDDFTEATVSVLGEVNMSSALSTMMGVCKKETPIMEYPRYGVGDDTDFKRGLHNMYSKYS